jgi:hypothetical protein
MNPMMSEVVVRDHHRALLDEASHRALIRQGKNAARRAQSIGPQRSFRHALAGTLRYVADTLDRPERKPTIWV